jgi:hypothetical protein
MSSEFQYPTGLFKQDAVRLAVSELTAYFSPSLDDRTHFSRQEAMEIARLVAAALPEAAPALQKYMRDPERVPKE